MNLVLSFRDLSAWQLVSKERHLVCTDLSSVCASSLKAALEVRGPLVLTDPQAERGSMFQRRAQWQSQGWHLRVLGGMGQ